jgi:hypothetical protein
MVMSISRRAEQFSTDRKFTPDEAKALVDQVKSNGIVSAYEKTQIKSLLIKHKDIFQPGAAELLKSLLDPALPPPPPVDGRVVNLDPGGSHRPVFLNASGVFTANADGKPPANDLELGDAIFRAAELVDDAPGGRSPFLAANADLRGKVFENLKAVLARVPADGLPPVGLDANQTLQLRASAATTLLELMNASPEAALQGAMAKTYEALVKNETNPRLQESMVFHLGNSSAAANNPAVKAISAPLMATIAPTKPPYDKWFAAGKNDVKLSWTVGQGEFWGGFVQNLKDAGFKAVGPENEHGVSTYERTINKPGVGETKFQIQVRQGGTDILAPMDDKDVQIVGYDGHSDWGRNMTASIKNGPQTDDGADGKLLFYNLCVGKGVLDGVKEKYGNAQVVTTYAASNFYVGANGQMTKGEGVQALLALVDGVAGRDDWTKIHKGMNDAADIGWGRTWDNYVTPISTQDREKVLDRDNDGQADYLDKHFNFNTFKVAEDTAREFKPVKQERPASILDGTKVLVSANMINTLSEFSGILDRINPDSKVISGGFFDPKMGEKELVRFTEQKGPTGKPEFVVHVSSRYSHMSEEALRGITVFEFTRYLQDSGKLRMDPVDAKLAAVVAFAQSLDVDNGFRDREVWSALQSRYNLPADLDKSKVMTALGRHTGHNYAGDQAVINALKAVLSPATLEALKKPEVGVPVTIVG